MTSVNEIVVQKLELNFKSVYIEGVKVLIKLLENIVEYPESELYRKIVVRKNLFSKKLFLLNDVESVLYAIGYVKNNNSNFILPLNVPVTIVQAYRDYFYTQLAYVIAFPEDEKKLVEICSMVTAAAIQPIPQIEIPGRPYLEKITFPKVLKKDYKNLQILEKISDRICQYEDKALQEFTLRHIIPMQILKDRVTRKISKIQQLIKSQKIHDVEELIYEDVFLIELLDWFNTSFFRWVDIECKICLKNTKDIKTCIENDIRIQYLDCCGERTIIYRYTDIAQLLKSRQGQAQEFANCFTFMCHCLSYEARYIHSNFGHAWTEIFLPSQNQWIHFDPSKNIFNAPLLYEYYFNNKVTCVVAFNVNEIQNVTRRYICRYDRALRARTRFKETDLLKAIKKIRTKRQKNLSQEQKNALKFRNAEELIWLKSIRLINEDVYDFQSLNSLGWKLCQNQFNICNGYTFELTDIEIKLKQFSFRYSYVRNAYERYNRITGTLMEQQKAWQKYVYECENICCCEEIMEYYHMEYYYLRRRIKYCEYGRIEWKFDFTKSGLRIKDAYVKLISKTYGNGRVAVWYQHEDGNNYKTTMELKNSQKFSIVAELSGDILDAKLFGAHFDTKDYPFEVILQFY